MSVARVQGCQNSVAPLSSIPEAVASIRIPRSCHLLQSCSPEPGLAIDRVAAIIGSHSGSRPRPGEISLAHGGVLFLDELPEWGRAVLEVLREPLESGRIVISRAARQAEFPARFQLVAAMNPCPCGYAGDPAGRCRCTGEAIGRYRSRLSGPLLDRIDLHVEVPRLAQQVLLAPEGGGEPSARVRSRVAEARAVQHARSGADNALLAGPALRRHAALGASERRLLEQAAERLELSARACHRILRVARTIADLDRAAAIGQAHLAEAVSYRCLDRPVASAHS
ncbi:MAG: ATP-binding protein [Xanthomonadales bacterium]|nr:ATP-binding protein [Xanthomonadales bacterium]